MDSTRDGVSSDRLWAGDATLWSDTDEAHWLGWLGVVDAQLNDVNGFHVKPADVDAALDTASSGPVAEGNVGGGTGMVCYGFKGGIGTSSRKLPANQGGYTVGALVQCNCGSRRQLRIGGLPVGEEISQGMPVATLGQPYREDVGSIIIVVATDAPMLPHQLRRLARDGVDALDVVLPLLLERPLDPP